MSKVSDIEKQILTLSPAEREQLAALAWDSLADDAGAVDDPEIDREGIDVATQRDSEIASGAVQPIDHAEFLRRTGGDRQ